MADLTPLIDPEEEQEPDAPIEVPAIQFKTLASAELHPSDIYGSQVGGIPKYNHERSASEFLANGGTDADVRHGALNHFWGMSLGAARGVAMVFDTNTKLDFWTDELYDELVAPQPSKDHEAILDADSEMDARMIVHHMGQQKLHLQLWRGEAQRRLGGAGAMTAELVASMTDPGMWITGFGAGAAVIKGARLLKTASKLASTAYGAGLMGSVEALTAYSYGKLAQSGNPMITDEEATD